MFEYCGYTYGPILGIIFWILVWIIVVSLIVRLIRGPRWHNHDNGRYHHSLRDRERSNALEILKERYAKGEIDKSEFEEMKADLTR